jgi:hypothetical protein
MLKIGACSALPTPNTFRLICLLPDHIVPASLADFGSPRQHIRELPPYTAFSDLDRSRKPPFRDIPIYRGALKTDHGRHLRQPQQSLRIQPWIESFSMLHLFFQFVMLPACEKAD